MPVEKEAHGGKGKLQGFGQKMADGTWGAGGVATIHKDAAGFTEVYRAQLVGPYFSTEQEAANAGLDKVVEWYAQNYPS